MYVVYACWLLLLQCLPAAVAPKAHQAVAAGHNVASPAPGTLSAAHTQAPRESIRRPLEVAAPAQARTAPPRSSATGEGTPLSAAGLNPQAHGTGTRLALRQRPIRTLGEGSAAHEFDYFPTAPPTRG